ncbi:hypothetical protein V1524DRAFT_462217 [Lipomyces starkeyi]
MPVIELKTGTSLYYITAGSPSPSSPTVFYIHGLGLSQNQNPKGYIATCDVIAAAPTPDFSAVVKSERKIPALVLAGGDDNTAPFEGCVDKVTKGLHAEV